jgi:hypothetical protein
MSDVKNILSTNALHTQNKEQWLYLYNSYVGGKAYRDANYLTRYTLETDKEYTARLQSTPLDNQCKSVISVYNSFLFRQEPARELGTMVNTDEVIDFLIDADFEGRSFNDFMKEVSTWSNVFGHCWVVLSKPNVNAVTRADEQAQGVRPYVSLMTPLVVIDWRWERTPAGRYELAYLKYIEEVNGDIQTIKEWTKEAVMTYVVDVQHETLIDSTEEENQLGVIPAVIAYSDRSIVRGLGVSQIADIADMQRFIYNCTSEVDQSIRLDSHPSLVTTSDTQVGVGAGAIIQMPENLDGNLKPYVLDFAGANITNIYNAINNTVQSIEKMANIGGVRATESRVLSGVALETEFQLLNSKLSALADNLELAEEQIWTLFALYQNTTYNGYIEYPGSFNIKDTSTDIANLKTAKEVATDPALLREIDDQLAVLLGIEDFSSVIQNGESID